MLRDVQKKEFEKFYRKNVDSLYRYVFFRTGQNKALAEDLVSEIFLKVLSHFDEYDPAKSATAWLMTIAKNHLANYWRDTKTTTELPEENDDDIQYDAFWLQAGKKAHTEAINKSMVYDLLAQLSKEDRELVTLHYLAGYKYVEIAEMLKQTEVAVKVATHRALKKIQSFL